MATSEADRRHRTAISCTDASVNAFLQADPGRRGLVTPGQGPLIAGVRGPAPRAPERFAGPQPRPSTSTVRVPVPRRP